MRPNVFLTRTLVVVF